MATCEHAAAAGGQTAPMQFEENNLSEVKRVIAVLSGKGGVGKSLVTGSLAVERLGSRAVMAGDVIDVIGIASDAVDEHVAYPDDSPER